METRFGRFNVDTHIVEDHPEEFAGVLAQMSFVPMKVERTYSNWSFEYIGWSPMFAEVEQGMMCPDYKLVLEKDDEGNVLLKSVDVVRNSMVM